MKKVISLLLIIFMSLVLFACSGGETVNSDGSINPMVEYESLEEINNKAKTQIQSIVEASEEKYYIVDKKIAQYDFKVGEANYTIRAKKDDGNDISGIYRDEKLLFEDVLPEDSLMIRNDINAAYAIFDGYRYVIMSEDENDSQKFLNIYSEFYNELVNVYTSDEINNLIGEYQDSYSKRATMEISTVDINKVAIAITWSSSSSKFDNWYITASLSDSKLNYEASDIKHIKTVGDEAKYVEDVSGGYFELKEGKLLWNGSNDEKTNKCEFEKVS